MMNMPTTSRTRYKIDKVLMRSMISVNLNAHWGFFTKVKRGMNTETATMGDMMNVLIC